MPFSSLIDEESRRAIVQYVEQMDLPDDEHRYSFCEACAARSILIQCLGEDLVNTHVDPIIESEGNFIKMKRLAQVIEDLHRSGGFEHKKKDLRGPQFWNISFEIVMASYFMEMGCIPEFLGGQSRKKCEFILDDLIHVECKSLRMRPEETSQIELKLSDYLRETLKKVPSNTRGILLVKYSSDSFPSDNSTQEFYIALRSAFRVVGREIQDLVCRIPCAMLLTEIASTEGSEIATGGYKRLAMFPTQYYQCLPQNLKKALQDTEMRLLPRVWVDYKGGSHRKRE